MHYIGTIVGGKISCGALIASKLKTLEGKEVKVSLSEVGKTRTAKQNAFYHGVVLPTLLELFHSHGNEMTPEDMHNFVKQEILCLYKEVWCPDGIGVFIPGTTTTLSTSEWESNMERIRVWAAERGYLIPYPNENISTTEVNPE